MNKILFVHNNYSIQGGEDTVVEIEAKELSKNFEVEIIYFQNRIEKSNVIKIPFSSINPYSAIVFIKKLIKFKPDIVYFHNLWFSASPILILVSKLFGKINVVKLHNYRTTCLNDIHYLNKKTCIKCLDSTKANGVINKCYRNSRILSFFKLLHVLTLNFLLKKSVDRIIIFTKFHENILLKKGFSKKLLYRQQNNVPVSINTFSQPRNDYLYVGREEEYKGIDDLINLWLKIPYFKDKKLNLLGKFENYEQYINYENINFLGQVSSKEVRKYMTKSKAVIFPSKLFEGNPMVIKEAISTNTIVISSNLGGIPESFPKDYKYFFNPYEINEIVKIVKKVELLNQEELNFKYSMAVDSIDTAFEFTKFNN